MPTLKPATQENVREVEAALGYLRAARALFLVNHCPKAALRTRSAIISAEGALRHIQRRANHHQEHKP